MGIIGNVKNFFNTATKVVKNVIKNPSLLAPLAKNNTSDTDEQELNITMPDVQSGSSSETGSSWANEFLNTPTFDINNLRQDNETGVNLDELPQNEDVQLSDESNLDSSKIIRANSGNPVGEGNIKDDLGTYHSIYGEIPAYDLVEAGGTAKRINDALNWAEKREQDSLVKQNFKRDVAKEQEFVIKGGNPGWYADSREEGENLTHNDNNIRTNGNQPYLDVLEGRDDIIARIINNIIEQYPNSEDMTYEELLDARSKIYDEIVNGDYFRIKRLYGKTSRDTSGFGGYGAALQGVPEMYENRYTKEKWEKISNLNQEYQIGENYTPTEEEFWAYIEHQQNNSERYNKLTDIYKEALGEDTQELTEEQSELEQIKQQWLDKARSGIHNNIQIKIGSIDGGEAAEAENNYNGVIEEQINRILPDVMGVFELEKIALAKPIDKRNAGDWYIIDTANELRRALDKYAQNLNDWMNRILNEGVDDKGRIIEALDQFEDGSVLNEVLTDGLAHILNLEGLEIDKRHVSPKDYFDRAANIGRYKYMQENGSDYHKTWNWFDYQLSKSGDGSSETFQFLFFGTLYRLTNLFKGDGKWLRPQSMRYFDNDFSIGKTIETDDSWSKRTLKKYSLEFGEYVPEIVGNVGPDILLIAYSGPGGITKTVSNVGRIGKFAEGTRRAAYVKKIREGSKLIDKTLSGFEKIGAIGREWANINSTNARIWNIVDRSLTQFALGQEMDGKLSIYDSESYSDTSFWISMFGSLLGDILPEAKDFAGVFRTGVKGGRARTKTAGVWDLVDFISQSDENARRIAKQMGKEYKFFTEQDLKNYVRTYANVANAAEDVYKTLTPEAKEAAGSWTKDLLYNYVRQAYGDNSHIGKNIREMVKSRATSPADIIKYIGNIPGTIKVGPYTSIIQLKHGTLAGATSKTGDWYDIKLDALDGGFDRKLVNGFSESDLRKLSSIEGYRDVYKNKDKLFNKVRDKYYLTDDGLKYFDLEATSITAESLGVALEQAENARAVLKEKMKNLKGNKLQDGTIDALADWGGYDEVVNKVKEVLC